MRYQASIPQTRILGFCWHLRDKIIYCAHTKSNNGAINWWNMSICAKFITTHSPIFANRLMICFSSWMLHLSMCMCEKLSILFHFSIGTRISVLIFCSAFYRIYLCIGLSQFIFPITLFVAKHRKPKFDSWYGITHIIHIVNIKLYNKDILYNRTMML